MQTTALSRAAIGRHTLDSESAAGADAQASTCKKGFAHLLHELTLESVLAAQPQKYHDLMRSFLVDGAVPLNREGLDYLALWLVQNGQAIILNALTGFKGLLVPVRDEITASGLLKAMQSGLQFTNLKLLLDTKTYQTVLDAIIPLLAAAFSANKTLSALMLVSNDYSTRGLQPLFDVLADVKQLRLSTMGGLLPSDVAVIATLLARNKTLCALELPHLVNTPADGSVVADASVAITNLFQHLGDQSRLEHLALGVVPEHCQALLGDFLGSSESLVRLQLGMDFTTASEPLVAGFRKNTSVKDYSLTVPEMTDDIPPLLDALHSRVKTPTHFSLHTIRCRADAKDSDHIGKLIACNDSLESLTWECPGLKFMDLARLVTALQKNQRLETLRMIRTREIGEQTDVNHFPDLADTSMVPSLLENLRKNRTLTTLFISQNAFLGNITPAKFPMLQQVLDRNRAWKTLACSDGYVHGAAQGLFASMGMPVDTAMETARCLLQHKPRVSVGTLALVNKATYESAVAGRRAAHPALLNQTLTAMPDYNLTHEGRFEERIKRYGRYSTGGLEDYSRFRDMIVLLNGIATGGDDYSADDLRRIANHPSLGYALVFMMERSESIYLNLVRRFCAAAGEDVIRTMVTVSMPSHTRISMQQCQILKQSFEPDQQHLAGFQTDVFDCYRIDSPAALAFIGYNIAPDLHEEAGEEFTAWCIRNQAPGALMAWHGRLGSAGMDIIAGQFSGEFLKGIMARIPLLPNLIELSLQGNFEPGDAMVLHRALAAWSGLKALTISNVSNSIAFNLIAQGLMFNEGIAEVILCNLATSRSSPFCEVVSAVLERNATIQLLTMYVCDDDPELGNFRELALIDSRLEIALNSADTSDSEESSLDADQ